MSPEELAGYVNLARSLSGGEYSMGYDSSDLPEEIIGYDSPDLPLKSTVSMALQ